MLEKGQIAVGMAGWSYPDWEGIVYPNKRIDQLAYVSEFVDVIEINSTFYRPPAARNSQSWLRRTAEKKDFFFTAKLHRDFTHEGKLDEATVRQFHEGFAPLLEADRLRELLAQFRYDFADTPANRGQLAEIAGRFGEVFDVVVEVRHRSWERPEALAFLEGLGVSVCNLDYPVGPNSFQLELCTVGPNGYFRMHGRNYRTWFSKAGRDETYNYYYHEGEMQEIRRRVEKLAQVFRSLTVIANNHYRGAELANALELKFLLTGKKVAAPDGLLHAYPRLRACAQ